MDETAWADRAGSFDAAVDAYERARPTYPVEAVAWLVPPGARRVLDLGAGTGKLTRLLVAAGYEVVAVEPLAGMREELARRVPEATVLAGSAEDLPLPDGSVDAVLVAQAWHWFDEARASAEAARVLRPGGTLGPMWNQQDDSVGWVRELRRGLGELKPVTASRDDDPVPHLGPAFTPAERREFTYEQEMDLPTLLDNIRSRSYVITRSEAERSLLLAGVTELTRTHPDLAGRERFTMPYLTRCWRGYRR